MSDPLKDFVEQHKAEFDRFEAPPLKLDELKARIKQQPKAKKVWVLSLNRNVWMSAAASILIVCTLGWFFYNDKGENTLIQITENKPAEIVNQPANSVEQAVKNLPESNRTSIIVQTSNGAPVQHVNNVKTASRNIFSGLKDSTSASVRLLALLEIEKSGKMNQDILNMLTLTLNNDKNTNVRLGALNLMEKYKYENYVSSALVNSLDRQNDPIVQLGLVSLLGNMNNIKIDDKLLRLVNGPETFAAVRDEAYSILLNQNKL